MKTSRDEDDENKDNDDNNGPLFSSSSECSFLRLVPPLFNIKILSDFPDFPDFPDLLVFAAFTVFAAKTGKAVKNSKSGKSGKSGKSDKSGKTGKSGKLFASGHSSTFFSCRRIIWQVKHQITSLAESADRVCSTSAEPDC